MPIQACMYLHMDAKGREWVAWLIDGSKRQASSIRLENSCHRKHGATTWRTKDSKVQMLSLMLSVSSSLLSFVLTTARLTDAFDIYNIINTRLYVFVMLLYLDSRENIQKMNAISLGFSQTMEDLFTEAIWLLSRNFQSTWAIVKRHP